MSVEVEGTSQFLRTQNGWMARVGNAVMFFGDKNSHIGALRALVPDAEFNFLKQVHSDRIVMVKQASPDAPEADAQITNQENVALGIYTADCVPVLISSDKMVAAVHAGWRGLEASVVEKTVRQMRTMGAKPETLKAAVGPHIAKTATKLDATSRIDCSAFIANFLLILTHLDTRTPMRKNATSIWEF
jgi:YfiH family protein